MTSIEHDIRTLVTALQKKIAKGHRDKYITHIRFPRFKNIAPDARIEFQFPVTAFVGSNGSGKTSALHALYGAPYGKSTSDFWFATDADPIEEGSGEPTRFIYGHWLQAAGMVVETRKARVSKSGDPDYWEPTKAVEVDNMETSVPKGRETVPGRSKDRWNPVARQVLYLNFRSELSAFDKYFFFGQLVRTPRLRTKQDRMRLGATRLKVALDDGKKDHTLFGKKAVIANRNLTNDELKSVCDILG